MQIWLHLQVVIFVSYQTLYRTTTFVIHFYIPVHVNGVMHFPDFFILDIGLQLLGLQKPQLGRNKINFL